MAVLRVESPLREVEFRLSGRVVSQTRSVFLAAGFNGWDPTVTQMQRGADGDWTVAVLLPPGSYPYLYFVDGIWYNDPGDDGRMPSPWGREYSLKTVC